LVQDNFYLIYILIVLVFTNALAIAIAYYLFKWRKRTEEGDKLIVVPDEVFNYLDSNKKEINSLAGTHRKNQEELDKSLNELIDHSKKSSTDIIDFLSSIKKLADERSIEIQRFRDGYDFIKLEVFLKNIIRLIDQLENKLEGLDGDQSDYKEMLQKIIYELIILLENNNVEQIKPEIEIKYSKESSDYQVVSRSNPPEAKLAETINRIVKPGYRLILSADKDKNKVIKVIRPAKIDIYNKFREEVETNE